MRWWQPRAHLTRLVREASSFAGEVARHEAATHVVILLALIASKRRRRRRPERPPCRALASAAAALAGRRSTSWQVHHQTEGREGAKHLRGGRRLDVASDGWRRGWAAGTRYGADRRGQDPTMRIRYGSGLSGEAAGDRAVARPVSAVPQVDAIFPASTPAAGDGRQIHRTLGQAHLRPCDAVSARGATYAARRHTPKS